MRSCRLIFDETSSDTSRCSSLSRARRWLFRGNSVDSQDIKNNRVKSVDIKDEGVGGVDLGPSSVATSEVAASSLTGADIAEGTLDGVDADLLGGFPRSSFGGSVIGRTTLPSGNVTKYAAVSGVAPAVDLANEVVTVSPAQTVFARNLFVQVSDPGQQPGEAWSVTLRRGGDSTQLGCTTIESQCVDDSSVATSRRGASSP